MKKLKTDLLKALGRTPVIALGLALPLATTSVMAAAPASFGFDGFTVDNAGGTATINTSGDTVCTTAGNSCSPLVTGDGFLQEQVTSGGTTFIRTIITDNSATLTAAGQTGTGLLPTNLPYVDQSFVRQDQTAGILSKQRSSEVTAASGTAGQKTFSSDATLAMGWAQGTAGLRDVTINQNLVDEGLAAVQDDTFTNNFKLANSRDAAGNVTGQAMSIYQDVQMETSSSTTGTTTPNNRQTFVVEERRGTDVAAGGSITLGTAVGTINTSGTTGGTLSYAAGEDVMLTWIGQTINTANAGLPVTITPFGYEGVTNLTTPATVQTFSLNDTGLVDATGTDVAPFQWNTVFGTTGPRMGTAPTP